MSSFSPLHLINKHAAIAMILASVLGFAFPDEANMLLSHLPQVLFFLMFFTLIGINQPKLVRMLSRYDTWSYAVWHSLGLTALLVSLAYLAGERGEMLLAIAAVMATGSLFGAPAIIRSMGFSPMYAMALTIATTLVMPVVLFVNLYCFQTGDVHLDWALYIERLLIFIVGPMALSALVHRVFSETQLHHVHQQLSKITILLVMAFPFGLVGAYRHLFDSQPLRALSMLGLGVCLVVVPYVLSFYASRQFYRFDIEHSVSAAVSSGARNLLLTYTIAAPFVGVEFMPLAGAMQLPIYALPLLTKWWLAKMHKVAA
ncbi:hypothetical protein [Hydromonas duriensis]|nr:hypothetical protein [Hydromonas duriensis]